MKHYKYPSIGQFRNTIQDVQKECSRNELALPTILFTGAVKLHGTNAGIVFNDGELPYAQSRNHVIEPGEDNYGFANFVEENKVELQRWMDTLRIESGTTLPIVVYGEWCGAGIQKGIGLSHLNKMFVVFEIHIMLDDTNPWGSISDHYARVCNIENMYAISEFPEYKVIIDFKDPIQIQQTLVDLTMAVETECPVAAHFGIKNGIGEGIVWSAMYGNKILRFKVKGERHSTSNVKILAPVDVEYIANVKAFIDYAVTENRIKQAMQETSVDCRLGTGDVIRWVFNDIIKEETDVLEKAGLTIKELGGPIARVTKELFFKLID